MKPIAYLLLFPVLFLISCGSDQPDVKDDSTTTVNRDLFREGVDKLKRNGFLKDYSGAKLDSMVSLYRKDEVNGMKHLLAASGDLLHLTIGLNGRAPHEVYQAITDTIGLRFPDLKSAEVKWQYLPEFPGEKDTGWVLLQQKFGDAWYARKLYYFEDWPVDNFMYRMYNTMLADQGKDTRLFLAEYFTNAPDTGMRDDFMGDLDITQMGVMRLTKQQADTLLSIPELSLEPEQEFDVYTTAKVEEELQKLMATGLIDDKKWFDTVATDIRQNSIYKQEDMLDFFDRYFCSMMFDTLNPFNPYEEILMSLSMGSRGHFQPSGIGDEQVGQSEVHAVRFTFKGKVFERDYSQKNGVACPYILNMVNDALAEKNAGGSFYSVLTRDKVVMAVFIEDSKLEQVKKAGFFDVLEKGPPSELQIIYGEEPASF